MKNAILVPGKPGKHEYYDLNFPSTSNSLWFPWLTKQLIVKDIFTVVVEMPSAWQPRYDIWKKEFERFDIGPETILVGHSCGGGFLVRWLSEHKNISVGKVVLVAPWLNPDNEPESDTADFFDFTIDAELVARTKGVTIFNSDDDHESIHVSVDKIRSIIKNVTYKEFHKYGHFCFEDPKTEAFPELLNEVLLA